MGAAQSSEEKVFQSEVPISFSPDVVDQLSNRVESPEPSSERQTVLDTHIRARIQNEIEQLRREEDQVRQEIEATLERENLDKERAMAGEASEKDDGGVGEVKNSTVLQNDLIEIREKISKYQSRKNLVDYKDVKKDGDAVVKCYRRNMTTPLDCWREVDRFKASVSRVEEDFFKTLH